MIGSGTTPLCGYCGRPVIDFAVWHGGVPYHGECTHGPSGPLRYAQMPAQPGCTPIRQLTEDDVRRIVREEIAKTPNVLGEGAPERSGGNPQAPLAGAPSRPAG